MRFSVVANSGLYVTGNNVHQSVTISYQYDVYRYGLTSPEIIGKLCCMQLIAYQARNNGIRLVYLVSSLQKQTSSS
jgi:hypothetical protein